MSSQHLMHRAAWFGALSWLLNLLGSATVAAGEVNAAFDGCKSIRDFGVAATNTPAANKAALQRAIDWAAPRGAALFVDPGDEPYPMDGGLILKMNVSLVGVHGPVGRGTRHPDKPQPVGSVFRIEDETQPIIIEGQGHTALANVEAFSGGNPALATLGKSQDFLLVRGDKKLTVTLTGCRMRNYVADAPITRLNTNAVIQAVACVDKHEKLFNSIEP